MEAELGVGYAIQEEGVYSCVRVEKGSIAKSPLFFFVARVGFWWAL